jgi:HlyD family secretion protein
VRIVVWKTADALKVPTSTLLRAGEDWPVFSLAEGRATLRSVEIGQRNGLEAEILSGLA